MDWYDRAVEKNEISRHEIAVLQAVADGGWHTNTEIARTADVAPRTARAHTLKLVRLGILDQAEVFPGHRYRLSGHAVQRNRGYFDRLRRAADAMSMVLVLPETSRLN